MNQQSSKHPVNSESNHAKNQSGKRLSVNGEVNTKVKVIVGDTEIEVDAFKIVAHWTNPTDVNKKSYSFPIGMVIRTLYAQGIQIESVMQAVRIKVNSIYKKCDELIVYDNRPGNKYPILAWWQNGQWLPVAHPEAKKLK